MTLQALTASILSTTAAMNPMMFETGTEGLQYGAELAVFRQIMALFRVVAPVVEFFAQLLVSNVMELRANQ